MCRDVGLAYFVERDQKVVRIVVNGQEEAYEILRVNEFTSDRKRMSVVAKDLSNDRIVSFVKGADIAIMPRLTEESKQNDQESIDAMNSFAEEGFRTLMFAKKELSSLTTEYDIK